MPTLREILEAKKAKELKANAKPVLQPQAAPEKIPEKTSGTEGAIPTAVRSESEVRQPGTATDNSVLGEQGPPTPPPGLSTLQLIKWRKEHASVKNAVPVASNPNSQNIPTQEKQVSQAGQPEVSEPKNVIPERPTADTSGTIDTSELRRNLDYLANNIEQKELVGQVVRTIAMQLKQNPELTPYMKDADCDLVVRGLRRSYAIVARKKSEAKEGKASKAKMGDELSAAFKDAGFEGIDIFK